MARDYAEMEAKWQKVHLQYCYRKVRYIERMMFLDFQ